MSKTILAVDDSPSIRQLVGFTLRNAGYTVTEAPDGKAALELARKGKFDLIFTDVNMPGLDGIELTRSVRALPGWAGTPILILTTEASDEMKQKGKAAGATGWLVKPFDPAKLLAAVSRVIG
ncbi:response regulator [Silvimonas sp. JCM 19000]